jgi:hypothetical protein
MTAGREAALWQLLKEMVASGLVDLNTLRRHERGLGPDNWLQKDRDEAVRDQEADPPRWNTGRR